MADPRLFSWLLTYFCKIQRSSPWLHCQVVPSLWERAKTHGRWLLLMFASCNSEKLLPRQDFGTQNHFTFSKRAHPVTLILLEPEKRKKPQGCWEFGMMQKKKINTLHIVWDCWWWFPGVDASFYCHEVFCVHSPIPHLAQELFPSLLKIYCTSDLLRAVILGL